LVGDWSSKSGFISLSDQGQFEGDRSVRDGDGDMIEHGCVEVLPTTKLEFVQKSVKWWDLLSNSFPLSCDSNDFEGLGSRFEGVSL